MDSNPSWKYKKLTILTTRPTRRLKLASKRWAKFAYCCGWPTKWRSRSLLAAAHQKRISPNDSATSEVQITPATKKNGRVVAEWEPFFAKSLCKIFRHPLPFNESKKKNFLTVLISMFESTQKMWLEQKRTNNDADCNPPGLNTDFQSEKKKCIFGHAKASTIE